MNSIKTYEFSPISNRNQKIHFISINDRIAKGGQYVLKPHRTNFFILIFITHGVTKHLVDFEVQEIKSGDFLILSPGQIHSFFQTNNSAGKIIAFTEDFLLHKSSYQFLSENSKILRELCFDPIFNLNDDINGKTGLLIELIQKELSNPYDEMQEGILQNHLSSLLLGLVRLKREHRNLNINKDKQFIFALQFKCLIEKYINKQWNVEAYAKEMNISTRSLQKITDIHYGKTPKAMIQEYLLLESKRMLIDPSLLIKEIAYELGFNDPTNFSKFFRKLTKTSPEAFRNAFLTK